MTSRWGFVTVPIVAAFELGRQNTDRTTYGLRYLVLLMVSDSLSGGESMAEFMAGGECVGVVLYVAVNQEAETGTRARGYI